MRTYWRSFSNPVRGAVGDAAAVGEAAAGGEEEALGAGGVAVQAARGNKIKTTKKRRIEVIS